MLIDGTDIGPTNQAFAHEFDPGLLILAIVCPGYPTRSVRLRVAADRGDDRSP